MAAEIASFVAARGVDTARMPPSARTTQRFCIFYCVLAALLGEEEKSLLYAVLDDVMLCLKCIFVSDSSGATDRMTSVFQWLGEYSRAKQLFLRGKRTVQLVACSLSTLNFVLTYTNTEDSPFAVLYQLIRSGEHGNDLLLARQCTKALFEHDANGGTDDRGEAFRVLIHLAGMKVFFPLRTY